jgi:hypothetical protein
MTQQWLEEMPCVSWPEKMWDLRIFMQPDLLF